MATVQARRLDPKRPIAQAPNFEIRKDGTTIVSLVLSRSTEVTRVFSGRRVEYRLKDAQVGIQNNLNPLVTAHFLTPVVRVSLRKEKSGVALVLELRDNVQPLHELHNGPLGSVTLQVQLPKPTTNYPVPQEPTPAKKGQTEADRKDAKPKRGGQKRDSAETGPGPRL